MNRVAIVGYGFMGKTHYGAWKKAPGAKVVAVCDSNLAQLTAKTVGNVKGAADNSKLPKTMKVYDSFDKMLAAGGFDVVDITLPTPLHPIMSVAALKAGYHVICEKPMALDPKSCDRMIAAAKKAKRQLFVGQCVRFDPQYAFLREAVRDGRFGKVVAADFTRFCPAPRQELVPRRVEVRRRGNRHARSRRGFRAESLRTAVGGLDACACPQGRAHRPSDDVLPLSGHGRDVRHELGSGGFARL